MKFRNYFLLCLMAILTITGCKKNAAPKPTIKIDTDVYVVGTVKAINGHSVAAYWKNGVIHKVPDSTTSANGNAIAVDGANVYITGGLLLANGKYVATTWKNGVKTQLVNDTMASNTHAITVNGGHVYIAGEIYTNGRNCASYWKDGGINTLSPDSASYGKGIAVKGTDVYVAGWRTMPPSGMDAAGYWKNGIFTNLTDGSRSNALAIAMSATGDVYTTGFTTVSSGTIPVATYWINNGAAVHLTTDVSKNSTAEAIAISGNDIHIAGVKNSLGTYWKNGTPSNITIGTYLTGIAVAGSNVYTIGYGGTNGITCWKNNIEQPLMSGADDALGIVVVTYPHK